MAELKQITSMEEAGQEHSAYGKKACSLRLTTTRHTYSPSMYATTVYASNTLR